MSDDAVIDGSDTLGACQVQGTVAARHVAEVDGRRVTVVGTPKGTGRTTVGPEK